MIVPAGLAGGRGPSSTRKELLDVLSARPSSGLELLTMANALFSNNTLVSLLTFGLGILGGIPSLVLTFGNGLMLGAFFALHAHRGLLGEFTGWVSIHGVTELGAMVLFGAAGLKLGESVLFPGPGDAGGGLGCDGSGGGRGSGGRRADAAGGGGARRRAPPDDRGHQQRVSRSLRRRSCFGRLFDFAGRRKT